MTPSLTVLTQMHAAGFVALVVLLIAATTDVRTHKIRNHLTYPAMLIGLILASLSGCFGSGLVWGPLSLAESLIGIVVCGGLMLIPYQLSGGGAGDVKLAMAMGSLLGVHATSQGFAVGYVLAAGYIVMRFVCHAAITGTILGSAFGRLSAQAQRGVAAVAAVNPRAPIPLAGFFAAGMFAASLLGSA